MKLLTGSTKSILVLAVAQGCAVLGSNALPNNNPSFSSSAAFAPKQSSISNYYSNTYPDNNNDDNNDESNIMPQSEMSQLPSDHTSFEDSVAAWRQHQQNFQRNQTPQQQASSTDETGRLKLISTISKGSISFFFFILMWRSIHHFEMADVSFHGLTRALLVLPIIALFVGNMIGCVATFTPPNHKTKNRLKLILNADKSVEMILFIYHVIRLTIVPSRTVIREVYVGRLLTNFVFLLQCQLFTKVTWDGLKTAEYGLSDYSSNSAPIYDDYMPQGVYSGQEDNGYSTEQNYDQSYYRDTDLNTSSQQESYYNDGNQEWN